MEQFDLNSLRVASPCSMSWNSMAGDDRSRHCERCDLNVYNVAGMTRDDVVRLVGESNGRLCMRLVRRADGTLMTKDCPVGVRAYRMRVAGIASAALATVLGLFSISYSQQRDKDGVMTIDATTMTVERSPAKDGLSTLNGSIVDENGAVIPGFKVLLIAKKRVVKETASDREGQFSFERVGPGDYTIRIEDGNGFEPLVVRGITISQNEPVELTFTLKPLIAVMGDVIKIDTPDQQAVTPDVIGCEPYPKLPDPPTLFPVELLPKKKP